MLLEETRSEDSFRKAMKTSTVLVAEIENAIVGYVQISDVTLYVESSTDRDRQLSALYVGSDFQGRGIGRLLIESALEHPRLRAAENIYLDVWDQNTKALGLYRRYGFEVVGECDLIVGSRVVGDDLVMVRRASMSQASS